MMSKEPALPGQWLLQHESPQGADGICCRKAETHSMPSQVGNEVASGAVTFLWYSSNESPDPIQRVSPEQNASHSKCCSDPLTSQSLLPLLLTHTSLRVTWASLSGTRPETRVQWLRCTP